MLLKKQAREALVEAPKTLTLQREVLSGEEAFHLR